MSGEHRRRRRYRPRLYLRGRLGCRGCSLPLLTFLATLAAAGWWLS